MFFLKYSPRSPPGVQSFPGCPALRPRSLKAIFYYTIISQPVKPFGDIASQPTQSPSTRFIFRPYD